MQDPTLSNNAAQSRYEINVDGKLAAIAEYQGSGDTVTFVHTEVMPEFEGKGLGSKIAKFALDDMRARNKGVVAQCPFIAGYIKKHTEYADLLKGTAS